MGVMRFQIPDDSIALRSAVERSYIAGMDAVPGSCLKTWDADDVVRLERAFDESGNFYIPWPVTGHGELLLSTASLMERDRPYKLLLELARGTLNRLRSKAEIWRMAGLQVPEEITALIRDAASDFILATTSQESLDVWQPAAKATIRKSLDTMVLLGDQYALQVLNARHEDAEQLSTLLAGNLGDEEMPANTGPMFGAAFNSAAIPFTWKSVQPAPDQWNWSVCDKQMRLCAQRSLRVIGGPLLCNDPKSLPDWVANGDYDFAQFAELAHRFINAVVERYKDSVRLWNCASSLNVPGQLDFDDEQRLRLAVLAIESVRRIDDRNPLILTIGQPWGEYMAFEPTELTPMHFAELLVRADIGVAGIGLEINYGYWPWGTLPRESLEIGQHIDFWGLLGLPLFLQFTVPSSGADDTRSVPGVGRPLPDCLPGGLSPEGQKMLADRLLPVLVAKKSIQGLIWNQVFDSQIHRYAHGGVFDPSDHPKPVLNSLLAIRRDHLE